MPGRYVLVSWPTGLLSVCLLPFALGVTASPEEGKKYHVVHTIPSPFTPASIGGPIQADNPVANAYPSESFSRFYFDAAPACRRLQILVCCRTLPWSAPPAILVSATQETREFTTANRPSACCVQLLRSADAAFTASPSTLRATPP